MNAKEPEATGLSMPSPLRFWHLVALASALLSSSVGCSGTSETPLADPDVSAAEKNADGVVYPTDHIGTRSRTKTRAGDRIANFSFQGYVDGNPKGELKTISLADFYDPEAKRHRVLQIQGVAGWCSICASEARQTMAVQAALQAEGAVVIQILFQGKSRSVGPSLLDLEVWCGTYETAHPVLFDTNAKRLGVFGIDGFPWNALIDTRTMEILDQGTGAPADIGAYIREGLRLSKGPAATW